MLPLSAGMSIGLPTMTFVAGMKGGSDAKTNGMRGHQVSGLGSGSSPPASHSNRLQQAVHGTDSLVMFMICLMLYGSRPLRVNTMTVQGLVAVVICTTSVPFVG